MYSKPKPAIIRMNYDSIAMIYPLSSFFVRNIISKTNESDLFTVVIKSVVIDLAEGQFRAQIMIFAEISPSASVAFSHLENELVSWLKKKIVALRQEKLLLVAIYQPIRMHPFYNVIMTR